MHSYACVKQVRTTVTNFKDAARQVQDNYSNGAKLILSNCEAKIFTVVSNNEMHTVQLTAARVSNSTIQQFRFYTDQAGSD